MKNRIISLFTLAAMLISLSSCTLNVSGCSGGHKDRGNDGLCDRCNKSVVETVDFYVINDLHGKILDTANQPGLDELTTYLKMNGLSDENAIFLSAGDMWQGSSESNLTYGMMMTDWMNELGFAAMTLGNHEFDWGEEYIEACDGAAEFPFLAINVYDKDTNERVDYCQPSTVVDLGNIQIGVIGAVGDCYSSISADKVEEVYFKVGGELTELVMEESERLRREGADFIAYVLHDGYGRSSSSQDYVSPGKLSSYYDDELSSGYVDVVFEGHTHQSYVMYDNYEVYHLQAGSENRAISHVEFKINYANGKSELTLAETVSNDIYSRYADDSIIDELSDKYADAIAEATRVLGQNRDFLSGYEVCDIVARLYLDAGLEEWGDAYDIALGGGYLSARSPYNLYAGEVVYGDLHSILPFDNEIVLCSVSGYNLNRRFLNTDNGDYHVSLSEYGEGLGYVDYSSTYYVVVDSYTAQYAPNGLTVIAGLGPNIYARDLLAEYIENGGLE